MWHEARKQEKKIRRVIVDYRKRSERRHLYYEKIKQDPTKFLQVHGRKSKIHLDGTVAAEADNNNHMMPWQGDSSNMIDRFDVRTHLDFYREPSTSSDDVPLTEEDRKCNFERYRVLIWNEYKKISESQHLRQIYVDEQFPEVAAQQKQRMDSEAQKMILAQSRANIGYDYEQGLGSSGSDYSLNQGKVGDDIDSAEEDDEYEFLKELEEIPPLSEINMDAITALDEVGVKKFSLRRGGFGDSLLEDQDYIDKIDEAKALESEKQKMSGRKSRRERRLLKDERLRGRQIGRLSFVRHESSEIGKDSDSDSSYENSDSDSSEGDSSENKSPKNKIEYITSFGSETGGNSSVDSPAGIKAKHSSALGSGNENLHKKHKVKKSKSRSTSGEGQRSNYCRSRSRSRSRSKSSRYSSSSHPRRRSNERSYRRSRSRDRRSRSRSKESSSRGRRSSRSNSRERRSRSPISKSKSSLAKAMINSTSSRSKSTLLDSSKSSGARSSAIKKLTPQEKLKIKMQRALNKQLKVDRNADMEKRIIKRQEEMEREDDIREMAKKMRKRERAEEEKSLREYSELSYY